MAENRRILIIQGHPDVTQVHLGHELAHAYAAAATAAGHQVRTATPAQLDFPLLRSQAEWERGPLPSALQQAQDDIAWAQHLVLFFPLWMGDMPALVYRFYFRAHSVKSLERNILGFVGIAPIRETLIGLVDQLGEDGRAKWGARLATLGRRAA